MAEEPKPAKTDAEQCLLSLDPVMAAAIDAVRGDRTRPAMILALLAKSLKLKGYEPRRRGRPKGTTKPDAE